VLGFKSKKKDGVQPEDVAAPLNDVKADETDLKSLVFLRYMSKNKFSNPKTLEKQAIRLNIITLSIHSLSLVFCLMAIMQIWTKNSDVGLYVQRIDGVKLEVVNDARSKILLRKALQSGLTKEQIEELNLE